MKILKQTIAKPVTNKLNLKYLIQKWDDSQTTLLKMVMPGSLIDVND